MNLKKVLVYAGVAFVAFFLLTKPAEASKLVNNAFGGVADAAQQLSVFLSGLI